MEFSVTEASRQLGIKPRYDNYIGGAWRSPVERGYFENVSPVDGSVLCEVARSTKGDVELALDAAHGAKVNWARTSPAARAAVLLQVADRIEANVARLATAETLDNGKPIRETTTADLPLMVDQFRYFASCIRTQEGTLSEIDHETVAYHFHEPLGVVGLIIPWNFPLLLAAWKIAPAIAAGNCVVLKPAEQTPLSIMLLMELIGDLIPPGVVNVVNGFGEETGQALARSERIAKISFTGETTTGQLIMGYSAQNITPVTLELGGKSPNIIFSDVMNAEDDLLDKALEGFAMFALNQGEVCTCPSRALVQESIYEAFMERALKRVGSIRQGNPLDPDSMIGAQASQDQMAKILSYIDIGRDEGAQVLTGGGPAEIATELAGGFYVKPTVLSGRNEMRIFQEEIFGPVLAVATFSDEEEAVALANATPYGLGAGVWTRDLSRAFRVGRGIQAGRVWTNCYHLYPAHAAFGGYKKSGFGRETHKKTLEHYQQIKNLLVSYTPKSMGLF
ncbi:aldehyde dehydrogenase [Sphingopyxis indica]|uniref:aldehyde dehydrogenase family protein n=1 Tax=Sphingopyxis indica TaxID=436663 RepID=UPI0029392078|nr:aldehyde dehydrogenase family protein [Sphingopyxis indica]WOF44744.1 aldehyde dehydrogenase [Sphingopyxis indica]